MWVRVSVRACGCVGACECFVCCVDVCCVDVCGDGCVCVCVCCVWGCGTLAVGTGGVNAGISSP